MISSNITALDTSVDHDKPNTLAIPINELLKKYKNIRLKQ